ncbi:uncharacterized protein DS421_16g546800 [Arachis hypogaea]|nr:uncharacterized protein DS421_16g546800 [Arachis hypogaea]
MEREVTFHRVLLRACSACPLSSAIFAATILSSFFIDANSHGNSAPAATIAFHHSCSPCSLSLLQIQIQFQIQSLLSYSIRPVNLDFHVLREYNLVPIQS